METLSEKDLDAKRKLYYDAAVRLERMGDWEAGEKLRKVARTVMYQIKELRQEKGLELFYVNMLSGKTCETCGEEFKIKGKCWSYGDMSGGGRFPYRVIKRFCSRCFKEEVQLPLIGYAFKRDLDIEFRGKKRDLKIPKWLDISEARFATRLFGGLEEMVETVEEKEVVVASSEIKGLQLWGKTL